MNPSSRRVTPGIRLAALLVILFAATGLLFAQAENPVKAFFKDAPVADQDAVTKAEDLAAKGQWLSAWNSLSSYDVENLNGYALAEKIRLALDGYAQTALHLVFGFVDIPEGQDLESVRSAPTDTIEPVEFHPGELAKAIEDKGGAIPPVLSYMLGTYYYTVWKTYPGQWLEEDAAILGNGTENYDRALAYDTFTVQSLDQHSEMLMALNRYDGAESVLNKGLALDPENNMLILRLADTYLAAGRPADVFAQADKVIAKPADDNQLNDAYVVAVKAGLALQDKEILEKYISGFEKSFSGQYMPGLVRHLAAIRLGDTAAADAAADAVTIAFPGDPDIIRSILSSWLSANDSDSGFRYLARMIEKAPGDESLAALYFYKALLDVEASKSSPESIPLALADLTKAEEFFKKTYPEGHEVFGMINDLRTQWTEALNPSQASQEETKAADVTAVAPGTDAPQVQAPAAGTPATDAPSTTSGQK